VGKQREGLYLFQWGGESRTTKKKKLIRVKEREKKKKIKKREKKEIHNKARGRYETPPINAEKQEEEVEQEGGDNGSQLLGTGNRNALKEGAKKTKQGESHSRSLKGNHVTVG